MFSELSLVVCLPFAYIQLNIFLECVQNYYSYLSNLFGPAVLSLEVVA